MYHFLPNTIHIPYLHIEQQCCNTSYIMMPGSKGQKAVHACMIRLLNLGPAKHEEGVICVANQRIPNVCRIAGAACCGAIRNEIFRWHQLGAKDLLTPTSYIIHTGMKGTEGRCKIL